ncbi:Hpt domain-containing protein [Propionivibrio soli]|uniref:Hpt domain-containing protein n=1 Tax=Propionivibrio soli TaxID=2976531 RepID=UPI0021E86E8F|nr:Hpt domain-containing protein [Propionivibrio soli]
MNAVENARMTNPESRTEQPEGVFAIRNVRAQEALARFAGDRERYAHWLFDFTTHGPAAASQIRQAIANGSHEAAVNLTHALKGRTGMLGMTELHSIALSLEMTLKNGEPAVFWLDELERTAGEMSREILSVLGKDDT